MFSLNRNFRWSPFKTKMWELTEQSTFCFTVCTDQEDIPGHRFTCNFLVRDGLSFQWEILTTITTGKIVLFVVRRRNLAKFTLPTRMASICAWSFLTKLVGSVVAVVLSLRVHIAVWRRWIPSLCTPSSIPRFLTHPSAVDPHPPISVQTGHMARLTFRVSSFYHSYRCGKKKRRYYHGKKPKKKGKKKIKKNKIRTRKKKDCRTWYR